MYVISAHFVSCSHVSDTVIVLCQHNSTIVPIMHLHALTALDIENYL